MTNATALGRSLAALRKNSKPPQRLSFSNDSYLANTSTAPTSSTTRRRSVTTLSARNEKILSTASNLSHTLPYRFNNSTTARFMSSSITTKIQHLIDNNKVVVFSKSYCPFCTATKNLFEALNIDVEVLELDQMGNEGVELQAALFEKTSQRSVPNVFVNGKHLGGNDDTQTAARNGTLQEMLESN